MTANGCLFVGSARSCDAGARADGMISTRSAADTARVSAGEPPGPRGANRSDPGTEMGKRRVDKP